MSCCRRNPAYAGIQMVPSPDEQRALADKQAKEKKEKMLKGAAAVAGIGALAYMFSKGKK